MHYCRLLHSYPSMFMSFSPLFSNFYFVHTFSSLTELPHSTHITYFIVLPALCLSDFLYMPWTPTNHSFVLSQSFLAALNFNHFAYFFTSVIYFFSATSLCLFSYVCFWHFSSWSLLHLSSHHFFQWSTIYFVVILLCSSSAFFTKFCPIQLLTASPLNIILHPNVYWLFWMFTLLFKWLSTSVTTV